MVTTTPVPTFWTVGLSFGPQRLELCSLLVGENGLHLLALRGDQLLGLLARTFATFPQSLQLGSQVRAQRLDLCGLILAQTQCGAKIWTLAGPSRTPTVVTKGAVTPFWTVGFPFSPQCFELVPLLIGEYRLKLHTVRFAQSFEGLAIGAA